MFYYLSFTPVRRWGIGDNYNSSQSVIVLGYVCYLRRFKLEKVIYSHLKLFLRYCQHVLLSKFYFNSMNLIASNCFKNIICLMKCKHKQFYTYFIS